MGFGRAVATGASIVAVGGCAALVLQLSNAGTTSGLADGATSTPTAASSAYPAPAVPVPTTADSEAGGSSGPASSASSSPSTTAARSSASAPSTSTGAPAGSSTAPRRAPGARQATSSTPVQTTAPARAPAPAAPAPQRGQALPVAGTTSGATRVITVHASSYSSTTATLQAWDRAPGGGWLKHGGAILAHVGSDGLTTSPSEWKSATPIGSFTLTQAFGADSNPGTGLPYFRTTSADWWISKTTGSDASLYNTHQHCYAGCNFTQGDPNEHLVTELPYYNYAVVIDYNTRNAPGGVRVGAGSAIFLHVTDGTPTAGCVAIPQSNLISIMQWLAPSANPRILIGVG